MFIKYSILNIAIHGDKLQLGESLPQFHLIGFFIPFCIAIIYLPRALALRPRSTFIFFFIAGLLSYNLPIKHDNGVGVWAFYLVLLTYYWFFWTLKKVDLKKRFPAGPALSLGFMSVAIPDTLLTMKCIDTCGTVGGMGVSDGLIKFWLIPVPIVIAAWVLSEFAYSKDKSTQFCWKRALWFQVSPNPKLQGTKR